MNFKDNIAALNRRISILESRLGNYVGKSESWTRAELSALKWAVKELTEAHNNKVPSK